MTIDMVEKMYNDTNATRYYLSLLYDWHKDFAHKNHNCPSDNWIQCLIDDAEWLQDEYDELKSRKRPVELEGSWLERETLKNSAKEKKCRENG